MHSPFVEKKNLIEMSKTKPTNEFAYKRVVCITRRMYKKILNVFLSVVD